MKDEVLFAEKLKQKQKKYFYWFQSFQDDHLVLMVTACKQVYVIHPQHQLSHFMLWNQQKQKHKKLFIIHNSVKACFRSSVIPRVRKPWTIKKIFFCFCWAVLLSRRLFWVIGQGRRSLLLQDLHDSLEQRLVEHGSTDQYFSCFCLILSEKNLSHQTSDFSLHSPLILHP